MANTGTRGVSEGLRTGGHEDTREAALGVFFVLGSLFLCSGLKVGRVVPNPPLGGGRQLGQHAVLPLPVCQREKRNSIEVRALVGERTARDSRPYLRRRSLRGDTWVWRTRGQGA